MQRLSRTPKNRRLHGQLIEAQKNVNEDLSVLKSLVEVGAAILKTLSWEFTLCTVLYCIVCCILIERSVESALSEVARKLFAIIRFKFCLLLWDIPFALRTTFCLSVSYTTTIFIIVVAFL